MVAEKSIARYPHRPKARVTRLVQLVELKSGLRRFDLQIESGGLDGLLLFTAQSRQAVGNRIGDPEFHLPQASTC